MMFYFLQTQLRQEVFPTVSFSVLIKLIRLWWFDGSLRSVLTNLFLLLLQIKIFPPCKVFKSGSIISILFMQTKLMCVSCDKIWSGRQGNTFASCNNICYANFVRSHKFKELIYFHFVLPQMIHLYLSA